MIEQRTGLGPADIRQTNGNLELLERFIQEYLEDPEQFDSIPSGTTPIILPPADQGDPGLRRANFEMAERLTAEGRNVVLLTVGTESVTGPVVLVSRRSTDSDE